MHKSVYEQEVTSEEKEKLWKKLSRQGKINVNDRVTIDDMLNYNKEEWVNKTPWLQDLEVTVYEVEETFPTMYNMQKVVKHLKSRISGVEQETLNWRKRIAKHKKTRTSVQ